MKRKFYVSIQEILNKIVCVEAENEKEAELIACKAYYDDCTVMLDSCDYIDSKIEIELDEQEMYAKIDAERSPYEVVT